MVKKMKATQASLPVAIGIGIVVSVVISIAMAAVAALLISTEKMEVRTIPVCTAITHLLSAFAGSWTACFAAKEKKAHDRLHHSHRLYTGVACSYCNTVRRTVQWNCIRDLNVCNWRLFCSFSWYETEKGAQQET